MKLITLNTWGGRINQPLLQFIKNNDDTDIFCFQEMNNNASAETVDSPEEDKNLFSHIKEVLPEFTGYFSPQVPGTGHAIFIKKELVVDHIETHLILSEEEITHMPTPFPRILQCMHFKNLIIYNFHGVPKADKKDTPVRDIQTKRVLDIVNKDTNPKIIVGDFNLNPDTKAIAAFNLIFTNQMMKSSYTTTRSRHYEKLKEFPYADYIFTSPEIKVSEFKVLNDEVSDHLPLSLNFEIEI
ncbi:endonuclease/exonuclease/phosphatase family protein [Candidatus Nomurabacteria bacterium]|jgi:endonuclease/exonuclease/phosphatase family metal-dependent hydrolase|nr:MAG: endonuclease/exonuclease/phosphatase family protein [Candidatus Nomurabacteria bacterium]